MQWKNEIEERDEGRGMKEKRNEKKCGTERKEETKKIKDNTFFTCKDKEGTKKENTRKNKQTKGFKEERVKSRSNESHVAERS